MRARVLAHRWRFYPVAYLVAGLPGVVTAAADDGYRHCPPVSPADHACHLAMTPSDSGKCGGLEGNCTASQPGKRASGEGPCPAWLAGTGWAATWKVSRPRD